ncbi:MAG: phosphoribosylamine--glycine ligase [Roseiarcus sp.]|jgi:phosphoribosylamine--glycine ligase
MNVLILGAGAREHALALAVAKSPLLGKLYVAPGNPGCAAVAENVALDIRDHRAVVDFCRSNAIGLVVVGPEAPLVAGVADDLAAAGILCFGPSKAAARLEGSKGFTKDFCREFGVPTGDYRRFSDDAAALAYVRAHGAPIVVKADGLAAGKGVVVAMTLGEAEGAIGSMFAGAFGAAGAEVVVEDYLAGEEISFFALSDGTRATPFASAQDHKRVGDGDTGPNTGGMGAYSPPPIMTPGLSERVMREIVTPTVVGMAKRGAPFRGVLFAGLMIGADGPKLIEFNVRFGDPEVEAILARLDDDLLEFLLGCAKGALPDRAPKFSEETALTVVMAARGYPGAVEKGTPIKGLEAAGNMPGVSILHAATRRVGDALVSDGGRVLAVTALGRDVIEAQSRAYAAVDRVDWPGGFCRRDIGWRAIERRRGS